MGVLLRDNGGIYSDLISAYRMSVLETGEALLHQSIDSLSSILNINERSVSMVQVGGDCPSDTMLMNRTCKPILFNKGVMQSVKADATKWGQPIMVAKDLQAKGETVTRAHTVHHEDVDVYENDDDNANLQKQARREFLRKHNNEILQVKAFVFKEVLNPQWDDVKKCIWLSNKEDGGPLILNSDTIESIADAIDDLYIQQFFEINEAVSMDKGRGTIASRTFARHETKRNQMSSTENEDKDFSAGKHLW